MQFGYQASEFALFVTFAGLAIASNHFTRRLVAVLKSESPKAWKELGGVDPSLKAEPKLSWRFISFLYLRRYRALDNKKIDFYGNWIFSIGILLVFVVVAFLWVGSHIHTNFPAAAA